MNVSELNAINVRIFSGMNLFISDLALLVVLAIFISVNLHYRGWKAREDMAVRGAIGMFVYFAGMLLVRGWSIPLLILTKHGYPTITLENSFPISLVGTGMAMLGAYCMVRVFSPVRWSFWGWLIPAVIAVTCGVLAVQF